MSGRAYARHPRLGALGGATDINSFVPHRFRLEAPQCTKKLQELAIRRAIQRRCKEKNWKKLLRLRHTRLTPLDEPAEAPVSTEIEPKSLENGSETTARERGNSATEPAPLQAESTSPLHENGAAKTAVVDAPTASAQQREREALESTKRKLQQMEETLKTLSAEKHAQFQQLKDILIAEARSKCAPPPIPKKRRVDSAGSATAAVATTSNSPRLVGVTGVTGGVGAFDSGLSLLGAPSPSLLRAQSFSGVGIDGSEFADQPTQDKDGPRRP